MQGNKTDPTATVYVNTTHDMVWMKIPHFSGVAPVIQQNDTTAPQIAARATTYPSGQTRSKNGDTVTLKASVSDAGSGVKNASVNASPINSSLGWIPLSSAGGNMWTNSSVAVNASTGTYSLKVRAYDNADNGNTTSTGIMTVKVDNDVPTYSWITRPTSVKADNSVTVKLNSTDPTSNVTGAITVDESQKSMTKSGDNFTYTISVSSSRTSDITYSVTFSDEAANTNTSASTTLNVTPATTGDGDGVTSQLPPGLGWTVKKVYTKRTAITIRPGEPAEVEFLDDAPIERLRIRSRNAVFDPVFSLGELSEEPDVERPRGAVRLYFSLTSAMRDADVESVEIEFSLQRGWLDENDLEPGDVVLSRWVDGEWQDLETEVVDSDDGVRFVATSQGFSLFSIRGEAEGTPTPRPTERPTRTPTPTDEPRTPAPTDGEPTPSPGYTAVIALVALLSVAYAARER